MKTSIGPAENLHPHPVSAGWLLLDLMFPEFLGVPSNAGVKRPPPPAPSSCFFRRKSGLDQLVSLR
jgi:hypothetical protein